MVSWYYSIKSGFICDTYEQTLEERKISRRSVFQVERSYKGPEVSVCLRCFKNRRPMWLEQSRKGENTGKQDLIIHSLIGCSKALDF